MRMAHATYGSWKIQSILKDGPEAVRVRISKSAATANSPTTARPNKNSTFEWGGAYISFLLPTEPRVQRSYSVISSGESNELEFLVKNVRGGQASRFFHSEAQPGMALDMVGRGNNLWQTEWNAAPQDFIAFSGGIGISPVFSCLQRAMESDLPHHFTLYHSSPSERRQLLKEDFLSFRGHDRVAAYQLYTDTIKSDSPDANRIKRDNVTRWLRNKPGILDARYLISGPHGMMEEVHRGLDALNIPMAQRHTEYFTDRALSHESEVKNGGTPSSSRPHCDVEIEQDNGVRSFRMHGEGQSILKAAHQAGIDVPSSCRGGICLSCQAQVIEGQVQREGISGLTEQEKADGMVLCCRAQPLSAELKLRLIN